MLQGLISARPNISSVCRAGDSFCFFQMICFESNEINTRLQIQFCSVSPLPVVTTEHNLARNRFCCSHSELDYNLEFENLMMIKLVLLLCFNFSFEQFLLFIHSFLHLLNPDLRVTGVICRGHPGWESPVHYYYYYYYKCLPTFTFRGHFELNSKVTCELCIQIAGTPTDDLHGMCQHKVRVRQKAKSILAYSERLSRVKFLALPPGCRYNLL